MKWIAIFAVGAVAVGGTTVFLVTSNKNPPPRVELHASIAEKGGSADLERDAVTGRLASQVAALQLQVAQLNAAPAISAAPSNGGGASGEAVKEPSLSAEERRLADDQRSRGLMDAVEAAYRNEVPDRNWATVAQASVQAALKADNVHLQTRSVECRSETCRIEIADDGSAATQESLENLGPALAGALPTMQVAHTDDASGHHTILYFSRAAQK